MGSISAENRKSLMLFSGRGFPALAEEIGSVLGVAPTPMDAYDFANGEIFVRYQESVRGSDAFVVRGSMQENEAMPPVFSDTLSPLRSMSTVP